MERKGLVTIVRGYGDQQISDAIIRGAVSREIRLMQAQRDLLCRRRRDDIAVKIAIANELYTPQHESSFKRILETVIGTFILLNEWYKENKNECKNLKLTN